MVVVVFRKTFFDLDNERTLVNISYTLFKLNYFSEYEVRRCQIYAKKSVF